MFDLVMHNINLNNPYAMLKVVRGKLGSVFLDLWSRPNILRSGADVFLTSESVFETPILLAQHRRMYCVRTMLKIA